ncbi:MAG: oxidoreductase, partial [Lachnospiraceae bacterium]|nr:oxidoreductase [Lachnospiraceae bacterium]
MTGLYRVMPPIAPDYGGACEVLYELGGLVLIHDASGCTVNYVHFDEPRFGEIPSNVFCSGLTEIEAVMGDDEIVIGKAVKAAEMLKPAFIAFIGSSVPMVVGTDFKGIARLCEDRTGVPCFGFDTNGLRYYTDGASKAMLTVIKRFCEKKDAVGEKRDGINILGLIPMNYGTLAEAAKVKALFKNVRSSLGFDTSLTEVRSMASVEKNVVVSAAGLTP